MEYYGEVKPVSKVSGQVIPPAKPSGSVQMGVPGPAGKSAYQQAVEAGYDGTEAEFAAKLAEELPSTLPNPKALNIDGQSYDGSAALTVYTGAGKSVKAYGVKGDGVTNDTANFQRALASERVVYVPGGTYLLSGELVIGDNCCLELSQDTVLQFTQTSGNCITLGMSSSLKGNHATVKVPYAFSGKVVNAYSHDTTTAESLAVQPWSKWDPQWKSGRYVTDLNICKADSRGFHYSVDGTCNGTAVYISADGSSSSSYLTFMWGVHFSGLRIAGAFSYGIRAVNLNDGWLHEMRIEDTFIDACEIGVSLEDCKNTYISAIIQPRRAYTMDEVYVPYAKHGIKLIRSQNTDLSGSRVWDWDEEKTLWTDGGEYQHLAMIGDCSGTIINDFRYHGSGDTRSRIHTDTLPNLETLTILQEPIDRWFKTVNGVPYFYNGNTEEKLVSQTEMDAHFKTDVAKNFTDALPTAIGSDGKVYNGVGYKKNCRTDNTGAEIASAYYVLTGFIPCKKGDVIYADGMTFAVGDDYCQVRFYDANFNHVMYGEGNAAYALINRGLLLKNGNTYVASYEGTDSSFKLTLSGNAVHNTTAYARFVIYKSGWGEYPMISVNEEIKYTMEGFLADGVQVKGDALVLTSPGGKAYSLSVNDSGVLTATEITV